MDTSLAISMPSYAVSLEIDNRSESKFIKLVPSLILCKFRKIPCPCLNIEDMRRTKPVRILNIALKIAYLNYILVWISQ